MKVRFAVSASDLPDIRTGAYASLFYDGHKFGQTAVIYGSSDPSWSRMFILDINYVEEEAYVTVVIISTREVGRVQISVKAIKERKSRVFHEDLPGGGTIYVHASEHVIHRTTFRLQIYGKDLVKSRGKPLGVKPNPLYEIRSASGDLILHTSETKKHVADPRWAVAEVCLRDLCGGDPDAPFEITFFHGHPFFARKLIGSLKPTVNDLLIASAHDTSISMWKDGERTGKIIVLHAECIGFTRSSLVFAAAKEAINESNATALIAAMKSQAMEQAREEFEKARQELEARRKSEQFAKTSLAEANKAAEEARSESQEAAEVVKKIKEAGLMGMLKFQFVAKKLKNVETFTWIDKSDPFFVLQKVASERNGQINWSHVYVSGVVKNDLDPIWKECDITIDDLCSGDLDEPIRVVVFDWKRSGKHQLIGSFETTINGIISAQRLNEEVPLTNGNEVTGFIFVPYAEVVGFVDPTAVEKRAEELAEKAGNAHFFARGTELRLKYAEKNAKRAQAAAMETKEIFEAATEEASAARRRVVDTTVSEKLRELGLVE